MQGKGLSHQAAALGPDFNFQNVYLFERQSSRNRQKQTEKERERKMVRSSLSGLFASGHNGSVGLVRLG